MMRLPPRTVSASRYAPRPRVRRVGAAMTPASILAAAQVPSGGIVFIPVNLSGSLDTTSPIFSVWSQGTASPTSPTAAQQFVFRYAENAGWVQQGGTPGGSSQWMKMEAHQAYDLVAAWWGSYGGRATTSDEVQALDTAQGIITTDPGPAGAPLERYVYSQELAALLLASQAAFAGTAAGPPVNTGTLTLAPSAGPVNVSPTSARSVLSPSTTTFTLPSSPSTPTPATSGGSGGTWVEPTSTSTQPASSSSQSTPSSTSASSTPASGSTSSGSGSSDAANATATAAGQIAQIASQAPSLIRTSPAPPLPGKRFPASPSGACPPGYTNQGNGWCYNPSATEVYQPQPTVQQPISTPVAAGGLALAGTGAAWLLLRRFAP